MRACVRACVRVWKHKKNNDQPQYRERVSPQEALAITAEKQLIVFRMAWRFSIIRTMLGPSSQERGDRDLSIGVRQYTVFSNIVNETTFLIF